MSTVKDYMKTRFASTAFGLNPIITEDLSNQDRDLLFTWQRGGDSFNKLTADSLLQVKICDNRLYANKVLRSCHKTGIINPASGCPDTTKIHRSTITQINLLSRAKLRKLVDMLFFWEEELVRWRVLTQEEHELMARLDQEENVDIDERKFLDQALQITQANKRALPSLRDECSILHGNEALPAYVA